MNVFKFEGNENCQYKGENDFSIPEMCYVVLPSNCTDLVKSSLYLGFQMSSEACSNPSKCFDKSEKTNNLSKIFYQ